VAESKTPAPASESVAPAAEEEAVAPVWVTSPDLWVADWQTKNPQMKSRFLWIVGVSRPFEPGAEDAARRDAADNARLQSLDALGLQAVRQELGATTPAAVAIGALVEGMHRRSLERRLGGEGLPIVEQDAWLKRWARASDEGAASARVTAFALCQLSKDRFSRKFFEDTQKETQQAIRVRAGLTDAQRQRAVEAVAAASRQSAAAFLEPAR
jgi:hypothetical protein